MAKILAVDDDVAILHMIETILNKDGHLVTTASSPLEINMEKVNLYDLILLDIMMPGTDGFVLCSKIRKLVDCPILFLTAKTEESSLVNDRFLDLTARAMTVLLRLISKISGQNFQTFIICQ